MTNTIGQIEELEPECLITILNPHELSAAESDELRNHERTIRQGLETFFAVGLALRTIRDKSLYRVDYSSFEEYLERRWDYSRRYGYNLIEAAGVYQNVCAIAHTPPINEFQCRPLVNLNPDNQRRVWKLATERARAMGRPVSAAIVGEAKAIAMGIEDDSDPETVEEQAKIRRSEEIQKIRRQSESLFRAIDKYVAAHGGDKHTEKVLQALNMIIASLGDHWENNYDADLGG